MQADEAQMPAQYRLGVQRISAIKINNKVRRVQRERGQKSLFKYLGNYYFNYNGKCILLEDGDLSLTLKHLKSNARTVMRWVSAQEE